MHFLFLKTRFLFEGEDGGGGGAPAAPAQAPAAAPSGQPPADPHAGVPPTAQGATPPPAPTRPEYLPEKFWDAKTNQPRYEDLAKSYTELERRHFMRSDDLKKTLETEIRDGLLKDRPESPDQYELVPPKGFLPEGLEFQGNKDDPLFKTFAQIAHTRGLSQDDFSTLVGAYLESMALQQPDPAAEIKSLGSKAQERIETTKLWAQANIPKEMLQFVGAEVAKTAKGIEFLEWMMGQMGEPRQGDLSISGTSQSKGRLTADQLTQMQGDPRYFDPMKRDPAFVKQIEDGWRALAAQRR